MKILSRPSLKSAVLMLAWSSLVLGGLVVPACAQDQNGPPPGGFGGPGGPPPDGFGGGPPGPPPDGFGGGPGGPPPDSFGGGQGNGTNGGFAGPGANSAQGGFMPGGQAPLAAGTVQAIDAASLTLTIADGDNSAQMIKVGATAQIITQQTVTVADLKVGDQIAIQGVPTVIVASQIVVGRPPAGLPGIGGPEQGGPPRGGFAQPRATAATTGSTTADGTPQTTGFASAQGTIKALPTTTAPHLAISLGTDATLYLSVPNGVKLMKYTALTFDQIKVGDQIVATGQTGTDGSFAAAVVGVNLRQATRGGRGGFNRNGPGNAPMGGQGGTDGVGQ